MTNPFQQHGAFSWCELMTPDTAAAREFYQQLFGWQLADEPVNDMIYTVVKVGEQPIGGMMTLPPTMEGQPPRWGVYVTVDDIEATVQQVEALGGQVLMPPMEIPGTGRIATIRDPQGAVLSVITYL